jgi:hypothetical protein
MGNSGVLREKYLRFVLEKKILKVIVVTITPMLNRQ